jgi:transposase
MSIHKHCNNERIEQQRTNKSHSYSPSSCSSSSSSFTPRSELSMFGRMDGCIDPLTLIERAAIVTLHKIGWTGCDIAVELNCDEHAVSRWIHRWNATHSLNDADRCGRPRCTTDDVDQDIMIYSNNHHNDLPATIKHELDIHSSSRTVRRRLSEIDLHTYVEQYESEFLMLNLKRRISFAEGYLQWGDDEWSHVLWSDHTLFTLDYQIRHYVMRPPGHGNDPEYMGVYKKKEGAVWLWGCMCAKGLGHAELYTDTLTAAHYQRILKLNLVKSAHTFWPTGMWYYQQDNASPHTAGTSKVWFHNHGITLLDFPPHSSDLSPIENLWNDLKRRVYSHNPNTMEELEDWISKEWLATDLNYIRHICLSMPHRLELLLASKGHKIHY